ncbi:DUF6207 family protein [Streptomyces ossamyceticus]|nr:DUF6207 family protein [Streptomyces ossamyceticus]
MVTAVTTVGAGRRDGGLQRPAPALKAGAPSEAHVMQPGLAFVEVSACDEQTALAVQALLAGRWAPGDHVGDRMTSVPGEPGVRLRCYLDVRRELGSQR